MFSSQNHNFNAKTHTTTAYEPHYEVGKDFLNTHKTLLFKLAWTVLTKKDCNCARILNSKYLRGKHFLGLYKGNGSLIWKSILSTRSTLAKGACLKVRDEATIDIYGKILGFLESWGSNQPQEIPATKKLSQMCTSL